MQKNLPKTSKFADFFGLNCIFLGNEGTEKYIVIYRFVDNFMLYNLFSMQNFRPVHPIEVISEKPTVSRSLRSKIQDGGALR